MNMKYPTIDLEQLDALLTITEQVATDPTSLNPENCPYDRGTVAKIEQLVKTCQLNANKAATDEPAKRGRGRPKKQTLDDVSEVDKELDDLRKELNQLKLDGRTLETADRIQIIKTRAALFERIIMMKERVSNIKQQMNFITTVIGLMDDYMPQENREKMMKALKPYADGE